MDPIATLEFDNLDLGGYITITIGESYHSAAKCKDLADAALAAAKAIFPILKASRGFTTFTWTDEKTYDLSKFGDYFDEPDVLESWLCSFMLSNDLFADVLTSEDASRVLAEEYGIGLGGPFRPTNYISSDDEDAYTNAEFDELSIIAIEDKLILLLGVMAHALGIDYQPVADHFLGESGKFIFFDTNRQLFESIGN
jgi:tRNA U34 5-methylaminomethyl-2-thiouridine-forming methyltransferase MnmC